MELTNRSGGRDSRTDSDDVLRILDELERELRRLPDEAEVSSPPPETPEAEIEPSSLPDEEASPSPPGEVSPYLEDRLAGARVNAVDLGREAEELSRRASTLQGTAGGLQRELERAEEELQFLRSQRFLSEPAPPSEPAARREPSSSRRGADSVSPRARYEGFTAARYNQTMGDLKLRRRRVAIASLLIAAVVSFLLVWVAFVFHGPEPPLWLEVLPGIWMIPVPFFVLGFRGTHRVLRRNHFDLPEVR